MRSISMVRCKRGLALVVLALRIAVSLMLRKWFLAVMNDLSGLVIGDFLKVVVVVSVDDALAVNRFSAAVGVIWYRQVLDVWLLLTGALCLESEPISSNKCLHYRNVVNALRAAAPTAGFSHLRWVGGIVD